MRARVILLCVFGGLAIPLFLRRWPARSALIGESVEAPVHILSHNGPGLPISLQILPIGAVVQKLVLPDKQGNPRDVALGFDDAAPYLDGTSPYFGATVGRVANRIRGAAFQLDGKQYHVSANDGNNSLHGGTTGWSRHVWTPVASDAQSVTLQLVSPDGDEGYPGEVTAKVTYTLAAGPKGATDVKILFEAVTTAPTPINMAQHCYFNLGGTEAPSTVLDHRLTINASFYTPVDVQVIPTGEVKAVAGTPLDFREEHSFGERIAQMTDPPPGGYDTNFVLWSFDGPTAARQTQDCVVFDKPQSAVSIWNPATGIALDVLTNAPGLQCYSGNYLDGSIKGKGGVAYPRHGAFALETQVFPNSINTPGFPQCVLRPGGQYRHQAVWRFYHR